MKPLKEMTKEELLDLVEELVVSKEEVSDENEKLKLKTARNVVEIENDPTVKADGSRISPKPKANLMGEKGEFEKPVGKSLVEPGLNVTVKEKVKALNISQPPRQALSLQESVKIMQEEDAALDQAHSSPDMTDQWPEKYGVEVQKVEEEEPLVQGQGIEEEAVEEQLVDKMKAEGYEPVFASDGKTVVGYNKAAASTQDA